MVFLAPFHITAFEELPNDPVIQKYLHELAGPTGVPAAAAPPDGGVTDEEFAKELWFEFNDVCHALSILYENDLAPHRRVRGEDFGWLTYLWTFHYENIPENLEEEMYRLLDVLEERLDCERNYGFYLSEPAGIRFEFSEAMRHGFQCPEMGAQLEPIDNDDLIDATERYIEEFRDEFNVEVTGTNWIVVLAAECYTDGDARERAFDSLTSLVANDIGDLDVTYGIGVRDDGFISVTVSGDDETAARNVLRKEWGEVTPHLSVGETYTGTLGHWDDDGFILDMGIEVRIPTEEFGLGRGSVIQTRDRSDLVQHMPLMFVHGGDEGPSRLADEQIDRLYDWTRGNDRVNVNSVTRGEVRATVSRAGHAKDIVIVKCLGPFEQSIVCRDEIDPPGLLVSTGSYLPTELKCIIGQ